MLWLALQIQVTLDGDVTARTTRPDGEIVTLSLSPRSERFNDVEKRLEPAAGTPATRRAKVSDGALHVRVPVGAAGEYVLRVGDDESAWLLANLTTLRRDADRDAETVLGWIGEARELCERHRDDVDTLRHKLECLRDRDIGSLSKPFRLDAARRALAALIGRVGVELNAQRYLDDGLAPPDPATVVDACLERLEECERVAARERTLWDVKVLRSAIIDGRHAALLDRLSEEPALADALALHAAGESDAALAELVLVEERVRLVAEAKR